MNNDETINETTETEPENPVVVFGVGFNQDTGETFILPPGPMDIRTMLGILEIAITDLKLNIIARVREAAEQRAAAEQLMHPPILIARGGNLPSRM